MEKYMLLAQYDREMETRKWVGKIPVLHFPSDWGIRISPPFGGATVRFRVEKGEADVSVYLDCYDELGYVGEPYWEIYPNTENDCTRCLLNETDLLLKAIQDSLDFQLKS